MRPMVVMCLNRTFMELKHNTEFTEFNAWCES